MKSKTISKKIRKQLPLNHYPKTFEPEWKRQRLNENHEHKNTSEANENDDNQENSQDSVINVDKDDSPPAQTSSSSIPQPINSAFYPYVDPLHFFIDLRVTAGQDRKKEAYLQQALKNNILLDSNAWNNPIIGKNRVGSAFKVPGTHDPCNNFSAINLIANNPQSNTASPKYFAKPSSDNSANEDDIEVQVEVGRSFDSDTKSYQEK